MRGRVPRKPDTGFTPKEIPSADAVCAARFSLRYAAPELMAAREAEVRVAPQPAHDIWAMGVTTLELLTCARVFDPVTISASQVRVLASEKSLAL